MAKGCAHEKLVHEAPDRIRFEGTAVAMRVHVFLEVPFTVLEDKDELCFRVDDVVQTHNVDVLELLHERDLANRSRWCTLFGIKVDLFKCHNFICRSGPALGKAQRSDAGEDQFGFSVLYTLWRKSPRLHRTNESAKGNEHRNPCGLAEFLEL